MRPVRLTLSAAGVSQPVPMDLGQCPFNVGIGVVLSSGASLTYTVEHTFDDVWDPAFDPIVAAWLPHAELVAKTATADGNYIAGVAAIRLNVTAYSSGTARINILQSGIGG